MGVEDEPVGGNITTGIPDKLSLGINYNRYFTAGALSLAADYDITYIDSVTHNKYTTISPFTETTTLSIGADFAMPSLMIRAGYSTSDIGRTDGNNWGNEIISLGVAMPYDNNIIEASIEQRTYDFKQPEGVEESLLLTLSYHFVMQRF